MTRTVTGTLAPVIATAIMTARLIRLLTFAIEDKVVPRIIVHRVVEVRPMQVGHTVVAPLSPPVTHTLVVPPPATYTDTVTRLPTAMATLAVSTVSLEELIGRQTEHSSLTTIVTDSLVCALVMEVGNAPPHKHRKYAKHIHTVMVPLDPAVVTCKAEVQLTVVVIHTLVGLQLATDTVTQLPIAMVTQAVSTVSQEELTETRTNDFSLMMIVSGSLVSVIAMEVGNAPRRKHRKYAKRIPTVKVPPDLA